MPKVTIIVSPAYEKITAIFKQGDKEFSAITNPEGEASLVLTPGKYILSYNDSKVKSERFIAVGAEPLTIKATYEESVCYTVVINEKTNEWFYKDDIPSDFNATSIFNKINICYLKNGFLSPSEEGDKMVQFFHFAYRIYREGNQLYISITNNEELAAADKRFSWDAFTLNKPNDIDYFYIGAYEGSVREGRLKSLDLPLERGMTLDQAEAYARANGDRYHIMRHAQLKAILCLAIIRYGPFADFDNDLFGIHNFWGGIWEWIDGFKVTAPESALRSSARGLMTGATGWKVRPAGTTYTGFIPLLTSETAHPTEQIDVNFLYANRQIIFGGTGKPPFAFGTVKAGSSKDNIGARLIYV